MSETGSPTMIDIARHAGVALSTVSYALSGKRPVSTATRERVQRAIDELGFTPHAAGRALASRSSGVIALFFPASRDSLQVENHIFLAGVAEAASHAGYGLMVSTAAHDPGGPRRCSRPAAPVRIEGSRRHREGRATRGVVVDVGRRVRPRLAARGRP